jgi:hypothetical protein
VSYFMAEVGHLALPPLADQVAFARFVLGIPILLSIERAWAWVPSSRSSFLTPCWREVDSNFQFRAK